MRNLAFAVLVVFAQGASAADAALVVHGSASGPQKLSIEDLRKLPARKVRATPEHRTTADYECTSVAAVLSSTGALAEKSLRGRRLADYLMVKATDGYQAVFALPELDGEFTDRLVLLCYARDGGPLAANEGPLRLIVPDEKRHARWVRQ